MSEGKSEKPVAINGELLPATPRTVSLSPEVTHLPQGAFGMSLFARARYASERKQFEAYTQLVSAKNTLLRALAQQQDLIVEYGVAAERARNLDDLREIARLEIKSKLARIRGDAELGSLRFETEKERLLYERDRLRKAREALNAPPVEPKPAAPKPTMAEEFEALSKEIEEIEGAYSRLRADIVNRAGGEANLTEEQRQRLGQFELLRDKLLQDVMQVLL